MGQREDEADDYHTEFGSEGYRDPEDFEPAQPPPSRQKTMNEKNQGGEEAVARLTDTPNAPEELAINWKAEWEAACSARIADRDNHDEAMIAERQYGQNIINERDKWIVELIHERDAARATIAAQEETIRADGEALEKISNGYLLAYRDRGIANIARARLSARQEGQP